MLRAAAWKGAGVWTIWHLLKLNGQRTLCGLTPDPGTVQQREEITQVCHLCARVFLEPLI